mgnify:CR=1 FL=1|jgi:hypothetical protein|nr:MAG TPA: hypothetical protein [Caudoviricetes sp.]
MTNFNTFNQSATIYYNLNAFEKPRLKTLSQFTLSDFSAVAAYVVTDYHTVTLLELPQEKTTLINLLNSIESTQADKAIDAADSIRAGYSAVLQHLPRLTIIDYIKLLSDSASAADSAVNGSELTENPQSTTQAAPAILSNLIDKLTTETAGRSLRIKQFEAEQRARLRARAERRASLAERELIERRKQRAKQVQVQKTNLKMFIKALSVSTDEASFSQKVLKMADLIDNDLDL